MFLGFGHLIVTDYRREADRVYIIEKFLKRGKIKKVWQRQLMAMTSIFWFHMWIQDFQNFAPLLTHRKRKKRIESGGGDG